MRDRVQKQYFPLAGGLNLVSPPLATHPGELIDCVNYECLVEGGYSRIRGYSLYDGQATPTQAVPGTGPVLGVHVYRGDVYAIREDGTNGRLYKATASGWSEVDPLFTWSLGGEYRFANYNFYGQDSQEEMFIVNGVDKAVKFDGATLVQLTTGTGSDNPSAVIGHRFHLFLAVESSLVNSATGNPADFQAMNGAAEIAVGDVIRDLGVSSGALIVACQDSTQVLYGNDATDWKLDKLNQTGTFAGTMASIGGQVLGMDRNGVMSLQASQTYGNFAYASISQKVQPYIPSLLSLGDMRATINRGSNQYRLFAGKSGLYCTFSGAQLVGITKVLYAHPVICITNGLDASRNEISLFGSDDGNVYLMDQGNKFGGQAAYAFIVLTFHHFGGPTTRKRFRLLQADMRVTGGDVLVGMRATSDYGGGFVSRTTDSASAITGGALWDYGTWDTFIYDSLYHSDARARVSLVGTNMAVMISSDGTEAGLHAIYGMTIHFSPRRTNR